MTLGNDGSFYGTTAVGGVAGAGTVFRVTTNGTLTRLASFFPTNGANPRAALTLGNDGNFYGTTVSGGAAGAGTVFKVTTNGTLTRLASFTRTNGANPRAALTLGNDGNFYGTTFSGGTSGEGAVFKVTASGNLSLLVSMASRPNGANPRTRLTVGSDGALYGTTPSGGSHYRGTMFKVTTNGTVTTLVSVSNPDWVAPGELTLGNDGNFYGPADRLDPDFQTINQDFGNLFKVTTNGIMTRLASFDGTNGAKASALTLGTDGNFYGSSHNGRTLVYPPAAYGGMFKVTPSGALTTLNWFQGTNGSGPETQLTLGNDGNFYGTTLGGGTKGWHGTVFKMTPTGTLTSLASFDGTNDGAHPMALTLGADGNFYGTTLTGGTNGYGTVFKVTPNGKLTILAIFARTNGAVPGAALTLGSDGNLYGTTLRGGAVDAGTIFRITIPYPRILAEPSGQTNVVGVAGFSAPGPRTDRSRRSSIGA